VGTVPHAGPRLNQPPQRQPSEFAASRAIAEKMNSLFMGRISRLDFHNMTRLWVKQLYITMIDVQMQHSSFQSSTARLPRSVLVPAGYLARGTGMLSSHTGANSSE